MKVVQIINSKRCIIWVLTLFRYSIRLSYDMPLFLFDTALYKSIPSPMHEHNESITVIFTSLYSSCISFEAITAFWQVELKAEEKAMWIIFYHTFIQSSKKAFVSTIFGAVVLALSPFRILW